MEPPDAGLPAACAGPASGSGHACALARWTRTPRDAGLLEPAERQLQAAFAHATHEKHQADGGPVIHAIFQALEGSTMREPDRRGFLQARWLFWMLCATDGHANHVSWFGRPGGRFQVTPPCDVLSAYPMLGEGPSGFSPDRAELAMAVRTKHAHWKIKDIHGRHWLERGTRHRIVTPDGRPAPAVIHNLIARTPEVLAQLAQRLGVVQSRVADIEREPGSVSVEQLMNVLSVLGAQLVVRETKPSVPSGAPGYAGGDPAAVRSDDAPGTPPRGQW